MARKPKDGRAGLPPVPPISELIAAERQARAVACQQEIAASLARHNCLLVANLTITGSQVDSRVQLVAKPPPEPAG